MTDISQEAKQKILWLRELLKKNAPVVYQNFALRKKVVKEKKSEINKTEKELISDIKIAIAEKDNFIKGLEEDQKNEAKIPLDKRKEIV